MNAKLFIKAGLVRATALVSLACALAGGKIAAQDSRHPLPAKEARGEVELPFRDSKILDAILITVRVNGRDAVLILDTGSNRTMLSPEVADLDPRDHAQFQTLFPESAVKAAARWGRVNLQIAGQTWQNRQVVVKSQDELSSTFLQKIDGILGKDVLNEFNRVTIDFHAHLIRLSR
jgi:hypothetical protein